MQSHSAGVREEEEGSERRKKEVKGGEETEIKHSEYLYLARGC